jgi:predicted DNA-binding protein YlxM (UPF0122 family)
MRKIRIIRKVKVTAIPQYTGIHKQNSEMQLFVYDDLSLSEFQDLEF